MKQSVEIIDLGFSVADAENLTFNYDGENLVLNFTNWQEKPISVICKNTIGYKFQYADYNLSESESFDSCHIVNNSEWLVEHLKQQEAWENESWFHYKFNFNAGGIVEVLCSGLAET